MPLSKLREYLDSHGVKYLVLSHSLAYTAQGVAALAHVSGKKVPVYADAALAEQEEITFSAGTHRELVRMKWEDMLRLINPTVAELTYHSFLAA
jgi:prolyl-tRNA editing enzyme YbaK/EbsC (Cys-tRNA(Pro) deacylase)